MSTVRITSIANFRRTGRNELDWMYWADAQVEIGAWFWKKSFTRKVCRKYADYWFFVDSGEMTPGFQMEQLARAAEAQGRLTRGTC